ncbi:MAG TPA: hypothetical protein VMG41_01780 [Gemmatimonadales bacterium]|nr:hypothetical protein [Gemmatimonadales bacterium]
MTGPEAPSAAAAAEIPRQAPPSPWRRAALRALLHCGFLVISLACLAAYEHFKVENSQSTSLAFLVTGAGFGFAPLRDLIRIAGKVEGKALHLVHVLGGLGLLALPVTGVVSGAPVLTHAAMAPFAIMGAAQAIMHQNHPRNAQQAAALQRFASSLPEVTQFTSSKDLASPENAARAVAVLTDIIGKAQALGETELQEDPGFQGALKQVSTRFGANLGLDAVDVVLNRLASNPATAGAVPQLRKELDSARQEFGRKSAP